MKILDRYILRTFSWNVFVSLLIFVGVEVIEESFRILPKIAGHNNTFQILSRYLFYRLPYLINLVMPLSVLFGSLLCFGLMGRRGELVGIFACGVNMWALLKMPLIICSCIVCFSLYFANMILPKSEINIEKLLQRAYLQKPIQYKKGEYFVILQDFSNEKKCIWGLEIKRISGGKVCYHLVGDEAIWALTHWQVKNAKIYKFTDTTLSERMQFKQLLLSCAFIYPPQSLILLQYEPQHLTTDQLYKKLYLARECGINTYPIQTTLQLRYCYPASCLLTLLVGFFLIIQKPLGGLAYSFGISIVISMFYWGLLSTLSSLCEGGNLPAYILWLPNILLAGIVLLLQTFADKKPLSF